MSLVIDSGRDPVHYPRRDIFEFDEEVSPIFENMALRSIPMYAEMHRMHARMARVHAERGRRAKHTIVDIGASTGVFFKMLAKEVGFSLADDPWAGYGLDCIAVEPSEPMRQQMAGLPWVRKFDMQGHEVEEKLLPVIPAGADIVCMHYVLQFIPKSFKQLTLQAIYKIMRKNGLLFLGQKEAPPDANHKMIEDVLQELYIDFRKDNGYSDEEIAVKTKALKGSMWLQSRASLQQMLFRAGFDRIIETTRWGQFSSWVAVKS